MAEKQRNLQDIHETHTSNIGTVIGIGFVGVVILVSYITLYALYLARG